jgi:hypothetical protein
MVLMSEPRGPEGAIGRWLALLRDGSEEEQQLARTELGLILEARGLWDDAVEAYERNVAAGVSDPRPYERLAALARARGDRATEARTLRALANILAPQSLERTTLTPDSTSLQTPATSHEEPAAPAVPEPPDTLDTPTEASSVESEASTVPEEATAATAQVLPGVDDEPTQRLPGDPTAPDDQPAPSPSAADLAVPADQPPPPEPEPAPASDAKPRPERRGHRQDDQPEDEDPGVALHHVLEMHPEDVRHHTPNAPPQRPPRSMGPAGPGMSRVLVTLALLVPVLVVIVGAALAWPAAPEARPAAPPTGPLLATAAGSPIPTVEMRLIAGTVSPLASPSTTQVPTPAATPTSTPAPLAARCADVGLRFPEAKDSAAAVRAAYRDYLTRQGVTIDAPSPEIVGLGEAYAARHEEVVAGWMAVTLQREQRGLASFPLADYVASDVVVAVGPGEYQLRATVSPQGWSEIRSWPSETCEGAFMRNPAYAHWVDLMQASVGDITWALPTRQPTR